jgi:site-specific DNA recombinase
VTSELFDAAQRVGGQRRGSRSTNTTNRHPATKRGYLLRSYVVCGMCGRRMFGKPPRGRTYYGCQPGINLGQAVADAPTSRQASGSVQTGSSTALRRLLDERLFGSDRRKLLAAELGHEITQRRGDHAARGAALERAPGSVGKRDRADRRASGPADRHPGNQR